MSLPPVVYDLNGRLRNARGTENAKSDGLDLQPVHVRQVAGLVFICLALQPPPFDSAEAELAPMLQPQLLQRARVVATREYQVHANWKLVWENNRECFHCDVNHPQYGRAQLDRQTGLFEFPDATGSVWYSANRTDLAPGFVTESLDGARVGPLMGEYSAENVGTLRVRTLPNFWMHASCDYAMTTRLTPVAPRLTLARVSWLVDGAAVDGRDFDLGRLLPFWQLTSEQDWLICERQQRGVQSRAYPPGPLSLSEEYNVANFINLYLQRSAG